MTTQPNLLDILKAGRSLILVNSNGALSRMAYLLANAYWSHCFVPSRATDPQESMRLFSAHTPTKWPNAQLLVNAHAVVHGVRFNVDRVIWIGNHASLPVSYVDPVYTQAMARGDMPWGQPAKWHYTEAQLFETPEPIN